MAINPEALRQASQKVSLAGGFCQLSGALLVVTGGVLTLATVLGGGGLYGLLFGGSASFLLALAGAPVAALGSIANSQKASKEMLLLYIRDSVAEQPRRRPLDRWSRWEPESDLDQTDYIEEPEPENLQINREGANTPPPPPPPPRR